MRHKYFHCLELSRVPYPQTTHRTLEAARAHARRLETAWVGTIDGALDERWEKGVRVRRRTSNGKWVATAKGAAA